MKYKAIGINIHWGSIGERIYNLISGIERLYKFTKGRLTYDNYNTSIKRSYGLCF